MPRNSPMRWRPTCRRNRDCGVAWQPSRPRVTLLADLLATPDRSGLDAVHDAIGPDTIAKFLLTSGSTGNPKAVINTQRMMCANQVMLRETLRVPEGRAAGASSTGCRGITPSAATTISGSRSTTAARCISTRASRCPAASRRPCVTCARFRRRSISTSPRAMNRCCRTCATTRRCAQSSSAACMRCSSPARRCRRTSGTASTNWRLPRPDTACRC